METITKEIMKPGDFIYYRNSEGAHEPGRLLKIGTGDRVKIKSDGSGTTKAGVKWVSKKNVELQ
jgi:hypothetical protein